MSQKYFPGTARFGAITPLTKLTQRADYVAARGGKRAHTAPFVLQCRQRGDENPARIGLTVTRKVGGAVTRNHIKRRLRSAIASSEGLGFLAGNDYVLIARAEAAILPFEALTEALKAGLRKLHSDKRQKRAKPV
ncbi:MAG: ribonuclease P protein component [Pseudomonadota bacterium]